MSWHYSQALVEEFSDRKSLDSAACAQLRSIRSAVAQCDWWSAEPSVGRVADRVSYRVDRIRAIGNAQVPRVVAEVLTRHIAGSSGDFFCTDGKDC